MQQEAECEIADNSLFYGRYHPTFDNWKKLQLAPEDQKFHCQLRSLAYQPHLLTKEQRQSVLALQ
jgi:hypothetical protein